MVADFGAHLDRLPTSDGRLIAFLGSTIGNLDPVERSRFFRALRAELAAGDAFLLGVDLVKDEHRLVAAYDDDAGVTADFNRNVLRVLTAELAAVGFRLTSWWTDPAGDFVVALSVPDL